MLRSLLYEIRMWPTLWRYRLTMYWRIGEKDNLGFIAMLGMPFIAIAVIVYFAFTARSTIDGSRIDAALERARELNCLAENIYFEARGEPLKGQFAVAEVTMNRLSSRHFPKTVCDVVHEARWDPIRRRRVAHFSWTEIEPRSEPRGPAWDQAMQVAKAVYDDTHMPVVPGALFYHADSIRPYWARTNRIVEKIGNHIFYR